MKCIQVQIKHVLQKQAELSASEPNLPQIANPSTPNSTINSSPEEQAHLSKPRYSTRIIQSQKTTNVKPNHRTS